MTESDFYKKEIYIYIYIKAQIFLFLTKIKIVIFENWTLFIRPGIRKYYSGLLIKVNIN